MAWKYDFAMHKRRENMTTHPLDRNRLQIQDMESMNKRKGGIRWIDWEAKVAGLKDLQPLEVWKDIYRVTHPLGQLDFESPEGLGDMPTCRLHKVEYSNRICKHDCREIGRCTSADCSQDWFKKLAKTAGHSEGLKALQRLQDLEVLVFSMRWR